MTRPRRLYPAVFVVLGILASGCGANTSSSSEDASPTDSLTLNTKADSVAYRLMKAHGGDAWASVPYLRFNFAVETPKGTRVVGRHFWDRTSGEYRVEWRRGKDSAYVALVNVQDVEDGVPDGTAYLNGTELTGEASRTARQQAYGRFINDTYWLLAPLKVFDPGVNRHYAADSSTTEHDVLRLTFGNVGLTPGDEYWLSVSSETGELDRWAFHLEGMPESAPPRSFTWTGDTTLTAPGGAVTLSTRKDAAQGKQAILTNALALPEQAPEGVFSASEPMLSTGE